MNGGAALAGIGMGVWSWLDKKDQAREMERQTAEEVRRMRLQAAQTVGRTTTGAASSGLDLESASLQAYLSAMTDEFRRQAEATLSASADVTNRMTTAANLGLYKDVVGSMFSFGGENNWFQSSQLGSGSNGSTR